jgi:hypothetical protein
MSRDREAAIDLRVAVDTYRRDRQRGLSVWRSVRWAWWTWRELPSYRRELRTKAGVR